ncbi:FtsX-like permease family protein [Mucilaginibacter pallidiroseus]|uniref:FtsX-like permease family protein n=1 Tax=Mucilaginibacter pallidiroseus TaxID=2599295 RepID=A0A563UJ10_9SPHI|nr:ABC transporter permease [Mucilaginibacter pallidiroseus]TWR31362.1 FtsX-like permease family protein [Mucilaginibacter pallidiroseus]
MFKINIKLAWRNLWKHKSYSLINIVGLTTGLLACLIVATVVIDELSYDTNWQKGDNIYRIIQQNSHIKGSKPMSAAFSGLAPSLKRDMPEVTGYCRMSVITERVKFGLDPEGVAVKNLRAEPGIWDLLDFKVLQGDPKKYVSGYTNVVISRKLQARYFNGQNVVGKIVEALLDFGKPTQYLVTGVIENIPQNTHLRADMITVQEYRASDNIIPTNGAYTFETQYILLKSGTDVPAFTAKVNKWYKKHNAPKPADYIYQFQPMKDIYLKSDFGGWQSVRGSIQNVYIFSAVAVLLLLIACINFVNLTISRVFNRAKETGIRKVLGAGKGQLMLRFLTESVLFFAISFVIALTLYPFLIKYVEEFMGHKLAINLYSSAFLLGVILVVLLVSLGTGLYPAWYLSKPKPVVILRDKVSSGMQLNILKKALVVGQFAISVSIIIITIVVQKQLNFMNTKDLGFDKNNLINIDYNDWGKYGQAFKKRVKAIPGVQNASITNWYPSSGTGSMSIEMPIGKEKKEVFFIMADADLADVLKFKTKSGRLLSSANVSDAMNADSLMYGMSDIAVAQKGALPLITTQYTANLLDLKLNKKGDKMFGVMVGVINDFYSESLHNKLKPTIIQAISDPNFGAMLIRVTPGAGKQVLSKVNKIFKELYPAKAFEYKWVGDLIDEQYKTEHKLQQLFTVFSVLIIFLACLGLFGLVTFTAEQRIKEIGIRKVLGAGVPDIVALISKDYLWLIAIAIVVASPVAWYAMSKWLQDFAYRINIQWWMFALGGVVAVLISLLTISVQSVKAAIANPVKSLRSE